MRLGEDYGVRLNQKYTNLKEAALERLSQSYSSHAFVIDAEESCALFERVRMAELAEQWLVQALGSKARFAGPDVVIESLTVLYETLKAKADEKENNGEQEGPSGNLAHVFEPSLVPPSAVANGNDPATAGGS